VQLGRSTGAAHAVAAARALVAASLPICLPICLLQLLCWATFGVGWGSWSLHVSKAGPNAAPPKRPSSPVSRSATDD
jgi:hypothetical protein